MLNFVTVSIRLTANIWSTELHRIYNSPTASIFKT